MTEIDILGLIAALFTTGSFVPQAIKVLKSRDTQALSLSMYSILTVGVVLWLAYGIIRQDIPVIVANIVTLVLTVTILATKIYSEKLRAS